MRPLETGEPLERDATWGDACGGNEDGGGPLQPQAGSAGIGAAGGALSMQAIKGAGFMVLSRFLGRAIDFAMLLMLARFLTPGDFGATALAMMLVVLVDTILEVPVTQALVRLPSIDTSHLDTAFTLSAARSLLIALCILAAAWPFARFYGDLRLPSLLMVLAIGPISRSLTSPAMVRYIRAMNFRQAFLAEIAGKVCASAATIVVLVAGGSYWAIVANVVVASIAGSVATYLLAPYRPALSLARLADFRSFVGWYSTGQVVAALNWQMDRALLGRFVDKATLGRYALANDLSVMPTQSLIGPAMQSVMAAFALINADPARLQRAFLKAAQFAMLVSMPIAVGIAATADLIVALLLGPKWLDAGVYLRWLALSMVTIPYYQAVYALSLACDRPAVVLKLNLIDLALRVVLVGSGLWLLSVDGVIAARIAVSVIMFAFYLCEARELTGLGIGHQASNLWKIAAATAVMAVAVGGMRHVATPLALALPLEMFASVALGTLVYGGMLYVLGVRLGLRHGRIEFDDTCR